MRIGPLDVSTVNEWALAPGTLISWYPTPSSRARALEAPVSAVPPSYVQARHLRSFCEQAARGLDHSRVLIASRPGNFVMSFLDASIAPLSTVANSELSFRIYDEGRVSHQVSMWVKRLQRETTVTVLFPDNPVARGSVANYLEAMKSAYSGVADGRRGRTSARPRAQSRR